jgi:hypothetical protein
VKAQKTVVVANARLLVSQLVKQAVVSQTRNAKTLKKASNFTCRKAAERAAFFVKEIYL